MIPAHVPAVKHLVAALVYAIASASYNLQVVHYSRDLGKFAQLGAGRVRFWHAHGTGPCTALWQYPLHSATYGALRQACVSMSLRAQGRTTVSMSSASLRHTIKLSRHPALVEAQHKVAELVLSVCAEC